jgi:hypothetical protein
MCRGQKAYPVYVSFGNLDKGWRRKLSKHGSYLLGYLPVNAFEDITNDAKRQRLKAELVHHAMEKMLEPLQVASEQGVEMWCPDGHLRRIYPCVAAYTTDWPEQNLQCCTSEGGCPICKTAYQDRGNIEDEIKLQEQEETLCALRTYILTKNGAHLSLLGLKLVWPWWGDIPDINLAACITPDLLHQAFQGIFKTHLVKWMKNIIGVDVLDDRFAAMPGAEGIKHFTNGISSVSANRWTGRESKQLLAQFLPAVIGGLTPEMIRLVRALVDFMYRAHATSLTDSDLDAMDDDLSTFHELKELLVGKVYETDERFNKIAKLHMLRHWTHSIRQLGTPDGYNTEGLEHLHIEYAKVPWRASNKVRPLPQMVKYIQRQEAIRIHRAYLDRYLSEGRDHNEDVEEDAMEVEEEVEEVEEVRHHNVRLANGAGDNEDNEDNEDDLGRVSEQVFYPNPIRHMAAAPTVKNIPIRDVIDKYFASDIIPATTSFLTRRCGVPHHDVLLSPQHRVNVWHKVYLRHPPPSFAPFDPVRRDVVRAHPPTSSAGTRELGVWDVALYLEKPNRLREFGLFCLIYDSLTVSYTGSTQDIYENHGVQRKFFLKLTVIY